MIRTLLFVAVVGATVAVVTAQEQPDPTPVSAPPPEGSAPPPIGLVVTPDPRLPAELQAVVEAERSFSKRCAEVGIRDSFLEFFAPDAIYFNPEPNLARPDFEARRSSKTPSLQWEPQQVLLSRSGTLAVSTGPSQVKDQDKTMHGQFVSVWQRQPNGEWKVVLDIGTRRPGGTEEPADFKVLDAPPPQPGATFAEPKKQALLAYERRRFARKHSLREIYEFLAAPEARFHREGIRPLIGQASYLRYLATLDDTRINNVQVGGGVSGTLGYTYGYSELLAKRGRSQRGYYVRAWRWDGAGWTLLIDVLRSPE
jgi:ketosteroid isomerase-like protein